MANHTEMTGSFDPASLGFARVMEDLRVLLEAHRAIGQLETARGTLSQTDSQLTQAAGEAIGSLPYVEQIAAELRADFEAKLAAVVGP